MQHNRNHCAVKKFFDKIFVDFSLIDLLNCQKVLSKSAKICRQVSFFAFIIYHVHNRNHCAVDKIFDINDIFLDLFDTLANIASFCGHSSCPLGMGGSIKGEIIGNDNSSKIVRHHLCKDDRSGPFLRLWSL